MSGVTGSFRHYLTLSLRHSIPASHGQRVTGSLAYFGAVVVAVAVAVTVAVRLRDVTVMK